MPHTLTFAQTHCHIDADRLRIVQRGDEVLSVSLSPVFDGQTIPITTWQTAGPNSLTTSLGEYGEAFLAEKHGKLAFWIETPVKQFETVTYLSDGILSGPVWRSFISDDYDRTWDKRTDASVPIASAYLENCSPDGPPSGGMTDPDDVPVHWVWNVHVHAWALSGRERWLGISMPGPWGIGVTRLNMHRARFNLRFEALRPACTNGSMPVLYFCPNLAEALDVLDEHRLLSRQLGLMDLAEKQIPQWWTNPWQGYYDEWERHRTQGLFKPDEDDICGYYMQWVRKTRETTGVHDLNLNFEQGCFRLYGDYRPAPSMGTEAELRANIDAWRHDGLRAGHYIHPFIVNTKLAFYREHPEAFCQPKSADVKLTKSLEFWDQDATFAALDWTHPLGREWMLNWVEYLISDAPGCLNFDILRSNVWRGPDPRSYTFHDPDWGIGDLMTFKVQKLMYERAKAVKPDCLVTKLGAVDCYMQPTYDAMQIAENWTHTMDYWYGRTQIAARLRANTLLYTDPWFVTRTKWSEFFMGYLVCNIPESQAATHTTHCYYPSWVPLAEKHFRRRKSGYQIYLNARQAPSDEMRLTWANGRMEAYRCRTSGRLAGWYAAIALGAKGIVSYSETQALAAASETRTDSIPLPPDAELESVTRVLHDGNEEPCEYELDEQHRRLRLYIEDCGGAVLFYRVRYSLGKNRS